MSAAPDDDAMVARANEVAEEIRGTCKGLHEFATDEEQNHPAFTRALDDQVFECGTCGWWCEISEQSDDGESCIDCESTQDEDDEDN